MIFLQPTAAHFVGDATRICRWGKEGPLLPRRDASICPLLVDDVTSSQTGEWKPWTLPPTCAYPLVKSGEKYCVFTYHGFRDGLSISLMTSPQTAADVVALLEDPNPQWYEPSPAVPAPEGDEVPPYVVVDVPGRGKGVIATRDIRKGEVVIAEPATMISMAPPRGILPRRLDILAHTGFENLAQAQKKRVSEMATLPGHDFVWGRFDTNAFSVYLAGREDHRGLFPEVGVGSLNLWVVSWIVSLRECTNIVICTTSRGSITTATQGISAKDQVDKRNPTLIKFLVATLATLIV